jgi:hypothetical protein
VQSDVIVERLLGFEPLSAFLTFKLRLKVNAGMLGQHGLAAERLATDITGIPENVSNHNIYIYKVVVSVTQKVYVRS